MGFTGGFIGSGGLSGIDEDNSGTILPSTKLLANESKAM
jgi:hypothetical protein